MNKQLFPVAAVAVLGMTGTVSADEVSWYYRKAGVGYITSPNQEIEGAGDLLKGYRGFTGGLGLGYNISDTVRADITVQYSKLMNKRSKILGSNIYGPSMGATSLKSMVNVYYNFILGDSKFTPFITVGAGVNISLYQLEYAGNRALLVRGAESVNAGTTFSDSSSGDDDTSTGNKKSMDDEGSKDDNDMRDKETLGKWINAVNGLRQLMIHKMSKEEAEKLNDIMKKEHSEQKLRNEESILRRLVSNRDISRKLSDDEDIVRRSIDNVDNRWVLDGDEFVRKSINNEGLVRALAFSTARSAVEDIIEVFDNETSRRFEQAERWYKSKHYGWARKWYNELKSIPRLWSQKAWSEEDSSHREEVWLREVWLKLDFGVREKVWLGLDPSIREKVWLGLDPSVREEMWLGLDSNVRDDIIGDDFDDIEQLKVVPESEPEVEASEILEVPKILGESNTFETKRKTSFAYQGGAGVSYKVNDRMAVDLSYNISSIDDGVFKSALNHTVIAGIRILF